MFAFATRPQRLRWAELREQAASLQERFGLEFPRFVEGLKKMNACDSAGLQLGEVRSLA